MDYKEQIEQAKHAAEKWREKHRIVGVGEFRVDCMVDDLTRSITDLLARAEAAKARVRELETSFRTEKCENGPECAELGRARKRAEAAEARAEKAERERDAAVKVIERVRSCKDCGHYTGEWTPPCKECQDSEEHHPYFKWRGQKED